MFHISCTGDFILEFLMQTLPTQCIRSFDFCVAQFWFKTTLYIQTCANGLTTILDQKVNC